MFTAMTLDSLPYEMLKSIQTVSFIPKLCTFTKIETYDTNNNPLGTLNPNYGEIVWSSQGVNGWDSDDTEREFPQYAIVLTVK